MIDLTQENSRIAARQTNTREFTDRSNGAPLRQSFQGAISDYDPSTRSKTSRAEDRSVVNLTEEDDYGKEKDDNPTEEEYNTFLRSQNPRRGSLGGRRASSETFWAQNTFTKPVRNPPVQEPFRLLNSYMTENEVNLLPGKSVELRDNAFVRGFDVNGKETRPRNSFLKIKEIIQHRHTKAITLRGLLFQRCTYMNGFLEKKRNELCWILHVDEDDPRSYTEQSMETVPVSDVIKRRQIRMTNQTYPALSYRGDVHTREEEASLREIGVLVCRYMYVCIYVSADRRKENQWSERVLQRLRAEDHENWSEVDIRCGEKEGNLRKVFRGDTIQGGSHRKVRTKALFSRPREGSAAQPICLTETNSNSSPSSSVEAEFRIRASPGSFCDLTVTLGSHKEIGTSSKASRLAHGKFSGQLQSCLSAEPPTVSLRVETPPKTVSTAQQLKRKASLSKESPDKRRRMMDISRSQQYTFGDCFAGAGGMSRAAKQAGLAIQFAFDANKNACNSYHLNFPEAKIECILANEFIKHPQEYKVDILHLSPPCQPFSPAHTHTGKNDDTNTATLFAVGPLIDKAKPRIVTLEQTFGIVIRAEHQHYLNALIQVFTHRGFSIRWKLLNCADFGVPQRRLRVFMIASW